MVGWVEVGDGYDRWVHQSVGEREAGGDHMTERAREGGDTSPKVAKIKHWTLFRWQICYLYSKNGKWRSVIHKDGKYLNFSVYSIILLRCSDTVTKKIIVLS